MLEHQPPPLPAPLVLQLLACTLAHARSRLGTDDCQTLVTCLRDVLRRQAEHMQAASARVGDALLQAVSSESSLPPCADALAAARVLGALSARGLLQARSPAAAAAVAGVPWEDLSVHDAASVTAARICCETASCGQPRVAAQRVVDVTGPLLQEVDDGDGGGSAGDASEEDEENALAHAWVAVARDVHASVLQQVLAAAHSRRLATGDGLVDAAVPVLAPAWQDDAAAVLRSGVVDCNDGTLLDTHNVWRNDHHTNSLDDRSTAV